MISSSSTTRIRLAYVAGCASVAILHPSSALEPDEYACLLKRTCPPLRKLAPLDAVDERGAR
jgi:hypothetical protein